MPDLPTKRTQPKIRYVQVQNSKSFDIIDAGKTVSKLLRTDSNGSGISSGVSSNSRAISTSRLLRDSGVAISLPQLRQNTGNGSLNTEGLALTNQQIDILGYYTEYRKGREVALRMEVSESLVSKEIRCICGKLGTDKAGLIIWYEENSPLLEEMRKINSIAELKRKKEQKAKKLARGRRYYSRHKKRITERKKVEYARDPEKGRRKSRKYRNDNKERIKMRRKKYVEKNLKSISAYLERYRANHRKEASEYARGYSKRYLDTGNNRERLAGYYKFRKKVATFLSEIEGDGDSGVQAVDKNGLIRRRMPVFRRIEELAEEAKANISDIRKRGYVKLAKMLFRIASREAMLIADLYIENAWEYHQAEIWEGTARACLAKAKRIGSNQKTS